MADPRQEFVPTPVGQARLDWFPAAEPRATLVLGHGTATGVEAGDLQALAQQLPLSGISVVLVTQPYRVEHDNSVSDEASLDQAWASIRPMIGTRSDRVIVGGRSAGSQVACRTAQSFGAAAVLVLAYPMLGPGRPEELLGVAVPTLVVQGGSDPFGRPSDFPPLPEHMQIVEVPGTDHMFRPVNGTTLAASLELIVTTVRQWLDNILADTPTARLA